jgi:hypothetical protein
MTCNRSWKLLKHILRRRTTFRWLQSLSNEFCRQIGKMSLSHRGIPYAIRYDSCPLLTVTSGKSIIKFGRWGYRLRAFYKNALNRISSISGKSDFVEWRTSRFMHDSIRRWLGTVDIFVSINCRKCRYLYASAVLMQIPSWIPRTPRPEGVFADARRNLHPVLLQGRWFPC